MTKSKAKKAAKKAEKAVKAIKHAVAASAASSIGAPARTVAVPGGIHVNPKARAISGHGDFTIPWDSNKGVVNNVVSGGARGLVKLLGGGDTLASGVSDAASWFSKLLGFGNYTVKKNSLMTKQATLSSTGTDPPMFKSAHGCDIEITHREFVANVIGGGGAFERTDYYINPGNPILFPWMSTIANNFEEYQMLGLVFEFKTTSTNYSSTVGLGTVVMATDYDAYDTDFTSKVAMEQTMFACSAPPCNTMLHPVECDPAQNVNRMSYIAPNCYTKAQFIALGGDVREYVSAVTSIALDKVAAGQIGELWVTYHVRLSRPIVSLQSTPAVNYYHASWTMNTGTDNTLFNVVEQRNGILNCTFSVVAATTSRYVRVFFNNGLGYFNVSCYMCHDAGATYTAPTTGEYKPRFTTGVLSYPISWKSLPTSGPLLIASHNESGNSYVDPQPTSMAQASVQVVSNTIGANYVDLPFLYGDKYNYMDLYVTQIQPNAASLLQTEEAATSARVALLEEKLAKLLEKEQSKDEVCDTPLSRSDFEDESVAIPPALKLAPKLLARRA